MTTIRNARILNRLRLRPHVDNFARDAGYPLPSRLLRPSPVPCKLLLRLSLAAVGAWWLFLFVVGLVAL